MILHWAAADLIEELVERDPLAMVECLERIKADGAKATASLEEEAGTYFGQQRKYWSKDPIQFSGSKVYQRDDLFDTNLQASWREGGKVITGSDVERMASGRAPIGVDGKSVNMHHC
jgi:filamentous hemagglutinin